MRSLRSIDLKESNRLSVLRLLHKTNYSRVEIANFLQMSKPTVSAIVEQLMQEGLVVETGHGNSTKTGGKRPILLDLNARAGLIAAVHFNDSWFAVAITDLNGEIIAYTERDSVIHERFQDSFDLVVQEIRKLLEDDAVKQHQRPCICCGIALKGLVNTDGGILEYSASIPQWRSVPIRDYISKQLNMPVFIENDARAQTIAEMQLDNGITGRMFACVLMGVGIGTGIVVNNDIIRGAFNGAVTFAHTTIADKGPHCRCGNYGCWEALASVYALMGELERRHNRYKSLQLKDVYQLYTEGDPVVMDVILNHTGYWMGVGIANILNVFNPEIIVIQGQLNIFGDKLLQTINEVAKNRALPVNSKINIVYSRIKDRVEVKAAAAVVIKQFLSKEYHNTIWKNQIVV